MENNKNSYEYELEVRHLTTRFPVKKKNILSREQKWITAVNDVSFNIRKGETFGLVGESGCGKTTLGKTVLQLVKSSSGQVIFEGRDLGALNSAEMRDVRRKMQVVFQDPYSSLNSRMTVGEMLTEPLLYHNICGKKEAEDRAKSLLEMVGLQPYHVSRYPHEFSGGQRQRISIARALSLNPNFIICDEAISSLDVSVQAQIINLLEKIKEELDLTFLFIAHDLHVIRHISDRIGVMYFGRMVEMGDENAVYSSPVHPYTRALFAAAPVAKLRKDNEEKGPILKGELPSLMKPPSGCPFNTRCDQCAEICMREVPELKEIAPGHFCACHMVDPRRK